MMNKKGDKILSVYWFAILIIVAGGIFGMVYVFYGAPYDVREIESDLLINKLADCVSYAGRINTNFISNGVIVNNNESLLKQCHLIFNSSEWDEEQYYTEIDFYRIENSNNSFLNINAGNNKWLANCAIQENKEFEKLAKCNRASFYSIDDLNNQYIIKILSVVRKAEKNAKL
ncbi:hypothetical protein M0R19_00200 [Candidatus Pacearchaeota archaeon]|nr:hypothetical protein [Candidatus Pacearchaeota archaeon]